MDKEYLGVVGLGLMVASLLIIFGRALWLSHRSDIDEAVRRGSESLYCKHGIARKIKCFACQLALEAEFAEVEAEKKAPPQELKVYKPEVVCVPKAEIPKIPAELRYTDGPSIFVPMVDNRHTFGEASLDAGKNLLGGMSGAEARQRAKEEELARRAGVDGHPFRGMKIVFDHVDYGRVVAEGRRGALTDVYRDRIVAHVWYGYNVKPDTLEAWIESDAMTAQMSGDIAKYRMRALNGAWHEMVRKLADHLHRRMV